MESELVFSMQQDGDCSHEIKRHILLGRKVLTNLDNILKRRDITLPTKVRLVKSMVFPVVGYGCESWTVRKAVQSLSHVRLLWPHGLQHASLPRPSPTPRTCSNSCPLSQWCHPTFLSSVIPFSSCPQSLPASESFLMSQLLAWGGQSTGVGCHCLLQSVHDSWKNHSFDYTDFCRQSDVSAF